MIVLDKISDKLKLKGYFFNPSFIVFFRVSIGLLVLVHFLSYWSDFDLLYGKKSIIPIELNKAYEEVNFISTTQIIDFLELFFNYTQSILVIKATYIIFCLFIILGFKSRIFAILLLLLQISIIKSSILFCYGADYFESISLFYILLFPSNIKDISSSQISGKDFTIYKRILQYHLSIAYFFSGLDKIMGFNWWNGEAIWKAVNLPNFTNYVELKNITDNPYLYIFLGWFTIIVELFYPIFINLNKTRKTWLFLTIGMHIGIIILFNLYFFATIMIIWNLTSYYFNYYDENKKN